MKVRTTMLVAILALIAGACSSNSDSQAVSGTSGTTVDVALKEFSLTPNVAADPSGSLTFAVTNDGQAEHEFVILRTDTAQDAIPVSNNEASEDGHVDEIEGIQPGQTQDLTVSLPAGAYVLICNLPGHYTQGMHVAFTVS